MVLIVEFHCIFYICVGICVEAMCNPTIQLPKSTAESCLHAIHALLESAWARTQIAKDNMLYKELLNVMHRWVSCRAV